MSIWNEKIHALERAWNRNQALMQDPLDDTVRSIFDYAIRLSLTRKLAHPNGEIIDISHHTSAFRNELHAFMHALSVNGWSYPGPDHLNEPGTLAWTGKWHRCALIEACPEMTKRLKNFLNVLCAEYPCIDNHVLEQSLRQKRLVLCLGGGGGTGFVHLCLFQWLEELQIAPSMITGTSIGALLGCIRSFQTEYDAARTVLELPGLWSITRSLQPGIFSSKHGLKGLFRIDLNNIILSVAKRFGWQTMPTFRELRIPFACVSSGILQNVELEKSLKSQTSGILHTLLRLTTKPYQKAIEITSRIADILSSSQSVTPVTFGFDDLTHSMSIADAVSFSILVPGILNYELPGNHYKSQEIVDALFLQNHLFRLCDGGLTSNVPVRTAANAIQTGKLENENVYILGIDVFAPQSGDPLFYPLQQIANKNAIIDAEYADAFVRLKYLLSPLDLAPSLSRLKWLNGKFRKAFGEEMKIIQHVMKPLPALSALNIEVEVK